jgi:hypothetical protein
MVPPLGERTRRSRTNARIARVRIAAPTSVPFAGE